MPDPWERGRPARKAVAVCWERGRLARSGPQAHDCRPYGRAARVPGHASLGKAPSRQPQALYDHGPGYPGDPRLRRVAGGTPALPGSQPALGSGDAGLGPFHVRSAPGMPACPPMGRFTSGPLRDCRLARPRAVFTSGLLRGCRLARPRAVSRPVCSGAAAVPASAAWGARREPPRLHAPDPFRIPPSRNGPPCPPAPGCFAVAAWLGAPCPPPAPIRRAGSGSWHGLPGTCEPDPLGGTGPPRRRQSGCPWALRVSWWCFRRSRRRRSLWSQCRRARSRSDSRTA